MPRERTQTVLFMRHGIAKHNLRQPAGVSNPHRDPSMIDPSLVPDGQVGAIRAGQYINAWTQKHRCTFQLLVTSPLTRCIQTCILAFLRESKEVVVPIVCNEDVREAFGVYYSDKRRKKSVLISNWPQVRFDPKMSEDDTDFREDWREHFPDLQVRAGRFLTWLVHRPEQSIGVVSHGVFLETLFHAYAPHILGKEGKRIHNCDVFVCEVVSSEGRLVRIGRATQIAGQM